LVAVPSTLRLPFTVVESTAFSVPALIGATSSGTPPERSVPSRARLNGPAEAASARAFISRVTLRGEPSQSSAAVASPWTLSSPAPQSTSTGVVTPDVKSASSP
jgi:hypothetical protein